MTDTTHKHPLLAQGRAAPLNGVQRSDACLKLDYPSAPHVPVQDAPAEFACPACGRVVGLNWPAHVALLLAVAALGVIVGVWL